MVVSVRARVAHEAKAKRDWLAIEPVVELDVRRDLVPEADLCHLLEDSFCRHTPHVERVPVLGATRWDDQADGGLVEPRSEEGVLDGLTPAFLREPVPIVDTGLVDQRPDVPLREHQFAEVLEVEPAPLDLVISELSITGPQLVGLPLDVAPVAAAEEAVFPAPVGGGPVQRVRDEGQGVGDVGEEAVDATNVHGDLLSGRGG